MRLSPFLILLVGLAFTKDAAAYCQTRTCDAKREPCVIDARGCNQSGTPVRWTKMPLVFRFQRFSTTTLVKEEARAAVRSAFYRWTDVVCGDGRRTSLRFAEGDDIIDDKPLGDGPKPEPFGIFFRDRGWPHPELDNLYALTTLDTGKASGEISYADIEINTTTSRFATADRDGDGVDLQTVMTHEVGHFIGLAHSVEPNTIMAPSLCQSGDRCTRDRISARRLGGDDIAAVCAMYPPDAQYGSPGDDSGDGCSLSLRREPSASASGLGGGLVVLLGLGVLSRRRRCLARVHAQRHLR